MKIFKRGNINPFLRKGHLTFGGGECVLTLSTLQIAKHRNSHRRCSVKKGLLKNFVIFTGKHQECLFNKVFYIRFYYKETLTQTFSSEYCEIFKNTYVEEYLPQTATFYATAYIQSQFGCLNGKDGFLESLSPPQ